VMPTFKDRLVSILTVTPTMESDYVLLEAAATDAEDREIARLIHFAIAKARAEGVATTSDEIRNLNRALSLAEAQASRAEEEEERAEAAEEEARNLRARVKALESQLAQAPPLATDEGYEGKT
jgi:hypothetical protein